MEGIVLIRRDYAVATRSQQRDRVLRLGKLTAMYCFDSF
jgi:hypothetical protein